MWRGGLLCLKNIAKDDLQHLILLLPDGTVGVHTTPGLHKFSTKGGSLLSPSR